MSETTLLDYETKPASVTLLYSDEWEIRNLDGPVTVAGLVCVELEGWRCRGRILLILRELVIHNDDSAGYNLALLDTKNVREAVSIARGKFDELVRSHPCCKLRR